ncbi:MAG: hypothetical protein V1887_02355 [Candidatus Aenigmatarchaeota archaeon]
MDIVDMNMCDNAGYVHATCMSFVASLSAGMAIFPVVAGMGTFAVCDVYYRDRTGKGISERIYEGIMDLRDYFRRDPVAVV